MILCQCRELVILATRGFVMPDSIRHLKQIPARGSEWQLGIKQRYFAWLFSLIPLPQQCYYSTFCW